MNLLKPKYKPKKFRAVPTFAAEFLIFAFIFVLVWSAIFFSLNIKVYAGRLAYELGLGANLLKSAKLPAVFADSKNLPDGIAIPKIGVNAPLIAGRSAATSDILEDLKKGVVLYPGSARPGSRTGKTIILGHSADYIIFRYQSEYPTVFSLIDKLEKGDEVAVNFGSKVYKYRVEEKFVKTPKQLQSEIREDGLYLVSCWPVGTDYKRIVVRATLI